MDMLQANSKVNADKSGEVAAVSDDRNTNNICDFGGKQSAARCTGMALAGWMTLAPPSRVGFRRAGFILSRDASAAAEKS